jgi:hypothetical protein
VVEFLGLPGNVARGVVFGVAGLFLVVAAASSGPDRAQGLDGSLRKIATTPLGPWLPDGRRAGICDLRDLLGLRGALAQRTARIARLPGRPDGHTTLLVIPADRA